MTKREEITPEWIMSQCERVGDHVLWKRALNGGAPSFWVRNPVDGRGAQIISIRQVLQPGEPKYSGCGDPRCLAHLVDRRVSYVPRPDRRKLTDQQIAEIQAAPDHISTREMAEEYGVSSNTVQRWRNMPPITTKETSS